MNFDEAASIVNGVINSSVVHDGIIVKKLTPSNTLEDDRATNQTHIAITGDQVNMFPCLEAEGYFNREYQAKDDELKKYFVLKLPIYLHEDNVEKLSDNQNKTINFLGQSELLTFVSVIRSRRNNALDQIQLSLLGHDGGNFVEFRKLLKANDYFVLLKRKNEFKYDCYGIRQEDGTELDELNNKFYKAPTETAIDVEELSMLDKQNSVVPLKGDVRAIARKITSEIYSIDKFKNLKLILNSMTIGIDFKWLYPDAKKNYLGNVFILEDSKQYENSSTGGTSRTFPEEYLVYINNNQMKVRLSTQWVDSIEKIGVSHPNVLEVFIKVVSECYSELLVFENREGFLYLIRKSKEFSFSHLPELFKSDQFTRRFITSMLAKPFVILTGNSGTGKTRIAKQFAEYMQSIDENGNDNWELVPVGADWTDNTKILGFNNPLGNGGKGEYQTTKILNLILSANAHANIPYFLILDEMNLSHVERYFSDFLSHMETKDNPLILEGYKERVAFPNNLFVIGTVNIDESTYMFSPKVLDRANVIEFKPDENSVLNLFEEKTQPEHIAKAENGIAEAFLQKKNEIFAGKRAEGLNFKLVKDIFGQVYTDTEKCGFEFAYRTVKEVSRYISASFEISDMDIDVFNREALISSIDEQLLQKVLPKIHGNRKEIGNMLTELKALCSDIEGTLSKNGIDLSEDEKEILANHNQLPLSLSKITALEGKLANVQFASFI